MAYLRSFASLQCSRLRFQNNASILALTQPAFALLEQLQCKIQHISLRDWGEGAYVLVEPDQIYTYVCNPQRLATTRPV
jgi:hypothetical protein